MPDAQKSNLLTHREKIQLGRSPVRQQHGHQQNQQQNQQVSPDGKLMKVLSRYKKKPTHSQLTTQQLLGIGASVVLSFVIVGSCLGLIYLLAPYALKALKYTLSFQFFKDFLQSTPKVITAFDITAEVFEDTYFNKFPVLLNKSIVDSSLKDLNSLFDSWDRDISVVRLSGLVDFDFSQGNSASSSCPELQLNDSNQHRLMKLNEFWQSSFDATEYNPMVAICNDIAQYFVADSLIAPPIQFSISKGYSFTVADVQAKPGWFGQSSSASNKPKKVPRSRVPVFLNNSDYRVQFMHNQMGMPFHQGGHSWNALIKGKLRWFLYSTENMPRLGFDPLEPVATWVARDYSTLWDDQMPVEVFQLPGEILYVPEGWYRSYVGLTADNVLLSQDRDMCDVMLEASAYCNYKDGIARMKSGDFKGARNFLQRSLECSHDYKIYMQLGSLSKQLGDYNGAIDMYKQALSRNYRNPTTYVEIVRLYELLESSTSAELEGEGDIRADAEILTVLRLSQNMNLSNHNENLRLYWKKYLDM